MPKTIKYFFLGLPLCFVISVLPAQPKIDSVLELLRTDKPDTNKLIHLCYLSDKYETIGEYIIGMEYGKKAAELSDSIFNLACTVGNEHVKQSAQYYKAKALNTIGTILLHEGIFIEAKKYFLASMKIREVVGDKIGIAGSYNNIGNVYYAQGNYPEALKNHLSALKIREAIGDKIGRANSYNNIGNVYSRQGNFPEALKYYSASLKIREEIGDKNDIATSYNNIGSVYCLQDNDTEAQNNYFTALKIAQEAGDKSSIALYSDNIGTCFYDQNNFPKALEYDLASLEVEKSIGDKEGESFSLINVANIFMKQNKNNKAREYFNNAIRLSKESGLKEVLKLAYGSLTQLDSAKGNFKGAFENHKLYILYRDSLDNEETRKKTIQSQMTFDFDKKEAVETAEHKKELENQSALADEKSRKQRIVIGFVVGGLLLVVLFSGFLFNRFRITQKQKIIIEKQKFLVENKQKEILDSIHYAKRIQQSLMPTEKFIDRSLKRLRKE